MFLYCLNDCSDSHVLVQTRQWSFYCPVLVLYLHLLLTYHANRLQTLGLFRKQSYSYLFLIYTINCSSHRNNHISKRGFQIPLQIRREISNLNYGFLHNPHFYCFFYNDFNQSRHSWIEDLQVSLKVKNKTSEENSMTSVCWRECWLWPDC